jgi:hypothetical protein
MAAFLVATVLTAEAQAPPEYWVRFLSGKVTAVAGRDGQAGRFTLTIDANLLPSGTNQWNAATASEELANGPYLYGGQSVVAAYVGQSATYPHLFVTERTNLHTYAQDDLYVNEFGEAGQLGQARTLVDLRFDCEEFSYIQASKVFSGFLDLAGLGSVDSSICQRRMLFYHNYVTQTGIFFESTHPPQPQFYNSAHIERVLLLP